MYLFEEILGRLKYHGRIQSLLVVMAFCCCICSNGFAQLVYLTDSRSVSGSASVPTNGLPAFDYVTSYSPFSGSATPSAPFADFNGGVGGVATLIGAYSNPITGQLSPFTNSPGINAHQNSFLHSQELYFNSSVNDYNFTTGSGFWQATGSSSLQVSFSVSSPTEFLLSVGGLGDPTGTADSYNLSSADLGVLVNGNTGTMFGQYGNGILINYSGIFNPGDIYTLTLQTSRSDGGLAPDNFPEIGGLLVDLTVPEPSMTALAGLAFLIFLLRAHRCGKAKF